MHRKIGKLSPANPGFRVPAVALERVCCREMDRIDRHSSEWLGLWFLQRRRRGAPAMVRVGEIRPGVSCAVTGRDPIELAEQRWGNLVPLQESRRYPP